MRRRRYHRCHRRRRRRRCHGDRRQSSLRATAAYQYETTRN